MAIQTSKLGCLGILKKLHLIFSHLFHGWVGGGAHLGKVPIISAIFFVVTFSKGNADEDFVVGQEELIPFPQFHLCLLIRLDGELGQKLCHRDLHLHHGEPLTCGKQK